MNKLFTKIAALSVGLAMAVGVGVAVASDSKVANPVEAAGEEWAATGTSNKFELVTSLSSLSNGDKVVLVAETASKGMGSQATNNRSAVDVTKDDSASPKTVYTSTASSLALFTVSIHNVDDTDYLNFKHGTAGYLYNASTSSKNYLKTRDSVGSDGYADFTYNPTNFTIVSKACGAAAKVNMLYNNSNALFACYSSLSGSQGIKIYKQPASKTLSSIALSGTYPTEFTVGDEFSHEGMTVTATYSDSTSANVTSSATFSGYNMNNAGNQTVTVSYTEGGTTKTATYSITVSASTTPTLTLDSYSFSGYTGQSFSVTATFSNLESDLAWGAVGTGSISGGNITWSSNDHRNGTSTYSATLSGEGGKTITADADGVDAAQYVITITQTTVDITKSSTSIAQGKSETLAVTHNAISVGGLTWSSNNANISVDANGKVTVAKAAAVDSTATITATSNVDTSVSDTCTVTVTAAPLDTTYDFTANFGTYASSWGTGYSSHTLAGTTDVGGDYAATITMPLSTKQTGTITTMPVVADQASGDVIHISFELTASGYTLGDVSVTFAQWGTKSPTMKLFKGTTASGEALDTGVIGTKNTLSASSVGGTTFVVAMNDNSTSRNQVGVESIYISLVRENKLDHVTVSFTSDPADRTFAAGSNFAFNGTLTASYTVDAAKAVTPDSYHLNSEGGTAITTSTVLNVSDHNGKSVYVVYTEGGVTKSDSFTLIVNPAPATSVTLSSNVGSVALEEVFEVSNITATVNPSAYATQGVTWEVYDSDGLVEDSTYVFDGAEFIAYEPADVVFHVKSTATPSVYAEFTLTVTGDPIAHLFDGELNDVTDGSTTVFADVGTISFAVSTENFEGSMTYTWSSSNSSIISIDDEQNDSCDFYVEGVAGSARLSCRIQGSTKGDVTVYIDVTVSAVTVTSVTWTAPTIDVFSGTTLSSTSGWNVRYSTDSGKTDQTPDSFNVKLGGSTISLPHTWVAADDGKALCVEYGGVSSSTTTVAVTQSINDIYAESTQDHISDLTFTAACSGSGTADTGEEWTVESDGTESAFDNTKGIHYGTSSAAVQYIRLTSSDFTAGKITKVEVNASTASSVTATVSVTVGGEAFGGEPQSLTSSAVPNNPYTFTGNVDADEIEVLITKPSSATKAIYCKSVVVTYTTSSGQTNIANVAAHKAAQRVAVKFANAFNTAMGTTANCTEKMESAWATCSSAYNTFKSEAAALGEAEEAYAKNLIKYATLKEEWQQDYALEDCIEKMVRVYKVCVESHGQTAFMNDLRPLQSRANIGFGVAMDSSSTSTIVIISALTGLAAIGGYFFLRKRKVQ